MGNEILIINGEAVSDLDLRQMELLFSERSVTLTVKASHYGPKRALCTSWSDGDISRDPKSLLPPPNQSQLLEEFLDNFKKNTANGEEEMMMIVFFPGQPVILKLVFLSFFFFLNPLKKIILMLQEKNPDINCVKSI